MKAVSKFIALLSAGLLSAVAALASNVSEQAYLEHCRKDPEVPVPVSVVAPEVSSDYNGALVQLEFVVGTDGKPAEFSITFAQDDVLAKAVVEAVKQWRFQPAEIDGKPVAKKCSLPVRIVDSEMEATRFASLE